MPTSSTASKPGWRRLRVSNRQRSLAVDVARFRRVAIAFLDRRLGRRACELDVHFLGPKAMARANASFLQHAGPTDVITFDYSHGRKGRTLAGEILICPRIAWEQAPAHKTTARHEVVRYFVHGVLHLSGYDDRTPGKRRAMKREENRWMRSLDAEFNLRRPEPKRGS